MKAWIIKYKDHAYHEWYSFSSSSIDIYAIDEKQALAKAKRKVGGKAWMRQVQVTEVPMPE